MSKFKFQFIKNPVFHLVVPVVVNDRGDGCPGVLDVVKVPPDVASVDDGRVVGGHAGVGLERK